MSDKPLPRKALLAKAAALVWRLNAAVAALRLREARDQAIHRIAHRAVAAALR